MTSWFRPGEEASDTRHRLVRAAQDQLLEDHELLDHEPLDQELLDHEPVDHELLAHDVLDHEPVDHEPVDHEPVDGAAWPPPPIPIVATGKFCVTGRGEAASAALARISPAPSTSFEPPATDVAVDTSMSFTWSGVAFGYLLTISAATPAVIAVACDVPLPRKNRVPTRAPG